MSPIYRIFNTLTHYSPEAQAIIHGSPKYASISGTALFYPFWYGTMVAVYVTGLPVSNGPCSERMHGFHIHEGSRCHGTADAPFSQAGSHFNPTNCPHPSHAGDLPVLLSNHGIAFQIVYTERFTPSDVIGHTVIIHLNPDDYHTQPSGNSGEMIACGEIKAI